MFRVLVRKYLRDVWPLLAATAFIVFGFPWVRIWAVSQFDLSRFGPLIEQFRSFEKFSPVPLEQFLTYEGVIGLTYAEPIMILCLLVWSISRGSDVVSGELSRGTMEMLLAQPIGRATLMWSQLTVAIAGLIILAMASYLGTAAGIATNAVSTEADQPEITLFGIDVTDYVLTAPPTVTRPLSQLVEPEIFLAPSINYFSLGFFVLSLAAAVSSWDQYRWRTIGIVVGIYVLSALAFVLSRTTDKARWCQYLSFLTAYQPDWMVRAVGVEDVHPFAIVLQTPEGLTLGPFGYSLVLLAAGSGCLLVATYRFSRRDLPAPL